MRTIIRSGRFYFWPIIAANVVTMTIAIGGNSMKAIGLSLVISCLSSFGFLLNDLWDRDVDRVNSAGHFEESSPIEVRIGFTVGLVFLLAGLGLGFWLGPQEFRLAVILALALGAYTILLRRFLLIPTLLAAVLATSPLWTPLVLWAKNVDSWKLMFIAAIVVLVAAREIIMDTRDRLGDIVGGRDTLATVFGSRIAKFVGVLLTMSASVPFVAVMVFNAAHLPIASKFAIGGIALIILYLLVSPAVGTLLDSLEERTAIQRYVLRSRMAMALIPLLIPLLW
jgi:4-hydroxybenzoate polyprenyltransferase